MGQKRYFWLKLFDDFFSSKRIKKLRSLAGGDTYTIIYLKMQLKSLKTNGYLYFDGVMKDFAEEIALDIDENAEDVKVTIQYLLSVGLIECSESGEEYYLSYMQNLIGSESASTQRSRDCRARQSNGKIKIEAKTNAERQNAFRAKKVCEQNGHVPYIEDYMNKKRYNGNYYVCFKRDKCKCVMCGSDQQLCMHHIDGYDENKPENNSQNKMITLCRECHSNVHAGKTIPEEILESIGYFDFSNESNVTCNTPATPLQQKCNVEIDIEKEKDINEQSEEEKINSFFEELWQLYPRKKGKSSISKTKKKELYRVGKDKMLKALEIFKEDVKGRDEQYIPYGSTFFNTNYKDYVDRIVEVKPVIQEPKEEEHEMTDEEWEEYVQSDEWENN